MIVLRILNIKYYYKLNNNSEKCYAFLQKCIMTEIYINKY